MANQIITGGGRNEITLNNNGANYELIAGENILKGLRLYLKNNDISKNKIFYDEVIDAVSCSNIINKAISNFKKDYVDPKIESVKQEIINETKATISFVSCSNIINFKKNYVDPKIESVKQETINEIKATISFDIGFLRHNEFPVNDYDIDKCGDEYVSGQHTEYNAIYGIKNLSISGDHSISGSGRTWSTSSSKYWNGWISVSIPADFTMTVYIDNVQLTFKIGTAFSKAGNRDKMNTGWYQHYSIQVCV